MLPRRYWRGGVWTTKKSNLPAGACGPTDTGRRMIASARREYLRDFGLFDADKETTPSFTP